MKVRIKFAKDGDMRFIGHLDLMRYFQKVMRRADIDIKYSEGMSPHMIMSFAAPLGVGLCGEGEYVDIEISTPVTTEEAVRRMNEVMVEGVRILDFRRIEEGKAGKAMSLVAAADYTVRFRKGCAPEGDWQSDISGFFAQKSIPVMKETKNGETQVDIRPMIELMRVNAGTVFLRLATGSAANLKPDLVMDTYAAWKGYTLPPFPYEITRREVYADLGKGRHHRYVPLGELGTVITTCETEADNEPICHLQGSGDDGILPGERENEGGGASL